MEDGLAEKNHVTWESSQNEERIKQLRRIAEEAEAGGGAERREREHKAGKLVGARTDCIFCWMRGHLKSWINLCGIAASISEWRRRVHQATDL